MYKSGATEKYCFPTQNRDVSFRVKICPHKSKVHIELFHPLVSRNSFKVVLRYHIPNGTDEPEDTLCARECNYFFGCGWKDELIT